MPRRSAPALSRPSHESVWQDREARIYRRLLGQSSRGIFCLTPDLFEGVPDPQDEGIDPRWLTTGVLEFPPTAARPSWLYATSGLSNPWDQDPSEFDREAWSGLGVELVLETREAADWAITCLARLAVYDLVLAAGRYGEVDPIGVGSRIPLNGPIDGREATRIRCVAICEGDHGGTEFTLDSGRVEWLQAIGITEDERDAAKAIGTAALVARLRERGAAPLIDPRRPSCGGLLPVERPARRPRRA